MRSTTSSIALSLALACVALANGKVSREFDTGAPSDRQDMIIQYVVPPGQSDDQKITSKGGAVKKKFANVPASVAYMSFQGARDLAADPNVRYVSVDRPIGASMEFAGPAVYADMAFDQGYRGNNVGIAVIDSGINVGHVDLKSGTSSRVVYSENFVPGETTTADLFGHGTHVAGMIAGNATQSSGTVKFRGIASTSKIVNLRVLNGLGLGYDSAVIAAIDRAISLKSTYNIRVINLSLGRPIRESYTTDPLGAAVQRAWSAGIVVVVAAGNRGRDNWSGVNGYGTIGSPGNHPAVITVGAMRDMGTASRSDDAMASYSSKGPTLLDNIVKPDLVAPGNQIIATTVTNSLLYAILSTRIIKSYYSAGNVDSVDYFRLSGSSMSAGVVSGAAAVMIGRDSKLTPEVVKARLMKTATKNFPLQSTATDPLSGATYAIRNDIFTIGAGYLNLWAALNNTDGSKKAATSPKALYDSATGKVAISFANTTAWSESVWSKNVVWGDSTFVNGTNVLWGDNVVWGDSTLSGFNVVWGDNVLWGENVLWGTGTVLSQGVLANGDQR